MIVSPEEVPPYAGLIYIDELGRCEWVRRPPFLHNKKNDYSKTLAEKLYYSYQAARSRILMLERRVADYKSKLDNQI